MGTSRPGRWIAAAATAACVVAGVVLLLAANAADPAPTASASTEIARPRESSAAVPKPDARRRGVASIDDAAELGSVVVRVTAAEDGAPIAGAEVTAPDLPPTIRRERTDDAGLARFEALLPRQWTFTATAAGRLPRSAACDVAIGDEATLVLRLVAAATLDLRVEDRRTAAPIAGAIVSVLVGGDERAYQPVARTDVLGRCAFDDVARSVLRVTATAPGFEERLLSVRLGEPATTTTAVLRLAALRRMTGVVRRPDGTAAPRATVHVWSDDDAVPPGELRRANTATSDDAGRYEIRGLAPGSRYHADASDPAAPFAPSETVSGLVVNADGPDLVQDFTLREFGTVTVRVREADGSTPRNPMLVLSRSLAISSPEVAETGYCRIVRGDPGPLGVFVFTRSGSATANVELASGRTFDLDLVLAPRTTDDCTVVDDVGRPVAGAKIESQTTIGSVCETASATTDADGRAAVPAVGVGSRTLLVTAPGMLPAKVPAAWGGALRVVLRRAATLAFRLFYEVTGTPWTSPVRVAVGGATSMRTTPDADGRVRIECEPSGPTEIRVAAAVNLLPPAILHATLSAGATTDLGDVAIVLGRRLAGRVVDVAGRPIEGATVDFDMPPVAETPRSDESYSKVLFRVIATDRDGAFEFDFASPSGPTPLEVRVEGFLDLHVLVTVEPGVPLALTVERGGMIWGDATDPSGAALRGVAIRVLDPAGAEIAARKAGQHGEFDVRVRAGRYTVRAEDCDDVAIDLREGGDAEVRLVRRTR